MTAPKITQERREAARRAAEVAAAASLVKARELYPERFAPDGDPLIKWAGSDWFERLNSWRVAHGMAAIERPKKIHPMPEKRLPENTYSAEPERPTEVPF